MKSGHFGKCSHLIFMYILDTMIFRGDPMTPSIPFTKSGGRDHSNPQD